jgi:hypothetical protein
VICLHDGPCPDRMFPTWSPAAFAGLYEASDVEKIR